MRELASHLVPEDISDIRIYAYCTGLFDELPSRKSVKKAIDRGAIQLNGKPTSTGHWLKGGEQIKLFDLENTPPKAYKLSLEVLFEDEHLAVINKPAGLLCSGNTFKTVVNALSYNLSQSTEKDALEWPKPVHRLDKATRGILLIAKTRRAQQSLGQQFERREVKKEYHAVVLGKLEGKGVIEKMIDNKTATTYFKVLKVVPSLRSEFLTLVQLKPKTGRTHQLRIHLSTMGHAILGDQLYSPEHLKLKHKGLYLAATKISFNHPVSQQLISQLIEIPPKMLNRLKSEENRCFNTIKDKDI